MCFTVAILRKGVLMTTEQYYNSLPVIGEKKREIPELPEFSDYHLISGYAHPSLPVLTKKGIEMCEWGLIPNWIRDVEGAENIRTKTLNAKAETIFEKPSFSQNISSNRCILPVTGLYEWREFHGNKYPYYIQPQESSGFLLGSVFDVWLDQSTGKTRNTFSIVTTVANPLMETIHNLKKRMPFILSNADAQIWLFHDTTSNQLKDLMKPFDEHRMKAHTINRIAGNSQINRNYPEINMKVEYPELNQQILF